MKRRTIFILLVLMMIVNASCFLAQDNGQNPSQVSEEPKKDLSGVQKDLYENNLGDDIYLTDEAEKQGRTEQDNIVPAEDAAIEEEKEEYDVKKVYHTELPEAIIKNLKYEKYPISYDYLLITGKVVNVREEPTVASKILKSLTQYEKVNLLKEVKGQFSDNFQTDSWYKILWEENGELKYGYVFGGLAEPRQFQFEKMKESLEKLKQQTDNHPMAFIANYKNWNGAAPLYQGKKIDQYGTRWYQSAPAYILPDEKSEFRYIEDGTLVSVLDKQGNFRKIKTLNFQGEYWVPDKYVNFKNSIQELTKVIVVDRKNQNQAVFEYIDGRWNLVSYTLATTGAKAQYKLETPLGYYMVIETVPRFLYLHDITKEIDGYAPYGIRFNGGAFIHGVPVNFIITEDKRIDPGMREYLFTIGTVPLSHRCVRNYTSHAKFLYDWIELGKSAVIVIE